jgi:carbon starvation protein
LNSIAIALLSIISFCLAYKFYASYLSRKIFELSDKNITPAHKLHDGVDYVPAKKIVLFGHHFTSIAGAAPIVGPAIAVIWGWLPALLWVVLGTILIGGVHDLGSLVVSLRSEGKSIGELTRDLVSSRARTLFLLIIFFLLWIVLAVFALIIGILFIQYPETVLPVLVEMLIAVAIGFSFYKTNLGEVGPTLLAVVMICFFCYLGTIYPIKLGATFLGSELISWIVLILIYSFLAAVLPVWLLLQPRDFINAGWLFLCLGLMYAGLFILKPQMAAPAVRLKPPGAPAMFPYLFIVIACGAVSGFHSLVSSGTTAKQLNYEPDAKAIGYGAMLGEGALAVITILACTAGFASKSAWNKHYISWQAAEGLGEKMGAFVNGGGTFMSACGIPHKFAVAITGVIIISFALTSIDTATRLQRYIITELGNGLRLEVFQNRYLSGLVAVFTAYLLCLVKGTGKGGLILWPLFGTTNQLLAGLALLIVTLYLARKGKPVLYTLLPMIFIMGMTLWAMIINIKQYIMNANWLIAVSGSAILALALWLTYEACICFYHNLRKIESELKKDKAISFTKQSML